MGIFVRTFAAACAADAIDRAARGRTTRYWYPNKPGLPRPGTSIPYVIVTQQPATRRPNWDTQYPERPASPTPQPRPGPPAVRPPLHVC